jgi:hypothetical protein
VQSVLGGATMKRILEFFESIAFAGMKPGSQAASKPRLKWLGPLRGPVERLLAGGHAPTDPLYLTNRSLTQKLKSWSLIAIPCLVLAVGIAVILSSFLNPPEAKPTKEMTAAEITAKLLPDMDKDIKLTPASDVQVVEVKVDGSRLVGMLKNTTTREIAVTELIIDLTNTGGSQLGAVNAIVENIPPSGTKEFQIPIKQHDAAFALVRDIFTR